MTLFAGITEGSLLVQKDEAIRFFSSGKIVAHASFCKLQFLEKFFGNIFLAIILNRIAYSPAFHL